MSILFAVMAAAVSGVAPQQPAPSRPPAVAAARGPVPRYVVVEGQHPDGPPGFQSLTVICPQGLRAFGAGFSAIVHVPPAKPGAQGGLAEEGVESVRSYPDSNGSGWRVEGQSATALRTHQPWRLAARVVCMRVD